jgi:hypothetical protein
LRIFPSRYFFILHNIVTNIKIDHDRLISGRWIASFLRLRWRETIPALPFLLDICIFTSPSLTNWPFSGVIMRMKLVKSALATTLLALTIPAAMAQTDRITITAPASGRGTGVPIPMDKIIAFCGDADGCQIRLAMKNWDGQGRTASRSSLFFYNPVTKTWRAEAGDVQGTLGNGVTENVMNAWACYFTDGEFINWANVGDIYNRFSLLSWNEFNADCSITIIN